MTFQNLFSIRKLFSIALLVAFCSQLLTNVKAEETASRELAAPAYTEITAIFATLAGSQDSSTELSVAVNLATGQADAIVYCGGFLTASTTNNKPASLADIYKQGFYAYSSNAYASITMTGLIPATLYNVYCMTVSETDNTVTMPLSVALGKYSLGLTSCCKTATFTSTISSVFTGASTVSNTRALYVSLSNAPSTNVTFSLKLASATTGSTNPAVVGTLSTYSIFVPSTYTPNTPIPVVLVAGEVDTYTITFEAVAGAIVEYNLVGATTTLSVLSTNTEPNAPVLLSATFSADGTYVTATFDSPTNQGGYANTFSCGALLNFDGSSTATCSWKDSSNIVIYPYYSEGTEVLSLDSRITVVGSKILSYCSGSSSTCSTWNHFASSSVEVKVQASSSANLPTVVVSGPSTVGRCSPIVLDWSSSVGNAGRPWDSVTITVADPIPNDNVTHVSSFLASDAYTISPPVAIAQTYLIAGHTYTFTGVFCNFLGACGTASKAVKVSDATATPIVSINGLTTRTITTWSTLLVNAAAYTQNCDGSVSVADLTYTWSLFETGVTDTPVAFTSTSQNPAAFKLAPYALTVGDTYRVQVSVKTSKSESVTASVYVIVAASNLVAVLKDGSSRSIQVGSSYTIDASGSYDQDVVKVPGVAQTGLSYSWSCYQTLPSYSATCPVTLPSVTSGSTLSIATTGATAGRVARITVTVYDATRTTTAYTDITLTEKPSSVITVGSSLTSLSSVNVNQQITLKGSLTLVNACNATWSVDDSSLASKLSSVTLTPTVVRLRTLTPQVNSIELLIPGGVLPQRATLGFSLSCDSVTSVLSMTTNGSPLPGVFVVSPLTGTELTTQFTFSAKQWSDPDLPLSYQFGFISPSTGALLNFRGKSESSYAATKLAAGPATSNYAVFTALIVYDVYGASSSVQGNVTVSPAASESAKAAGITSLIAASSGSVDDTNSVIATVGVVLNNVDCTSAPNCASLYRSACSSVANTCGICLPGYLGTSGSDNSLCLTLDQYKDTGARRLAAGDDCSADASVCLLGRETCQSGKCVAIEKTCPNSCSSKGTCVFSTISTGDSLDTCAITDTSCQAECVCDDGYAGTNCGFTAEDMATRQALRSQLIRGLENVTQIDDINELSIQSWATSLSSLSQNAAELTTKEAAIVHNIVTLTIQYATTLGTTDYAALIGLLESLDSAGTVYVTEDRRRRRLGMDRRLTTAGAMDVLTAAGSFSKVVANGMAVDQTAATQIHNNFRLSTQINTARTGSTIDVQGPQSDLEYYSNANAPYISLTPGSTSTSVTSGMVLANAANYAGVSMNSNPMQIVIGPDAGLTKITYMVYNNKPTDNLQPSYVSPYFVHDCNTSVYSVFMTCPSGKVLETKCVGVAGKKTQQCDLPSPQCSVFDTSAYTTSKATGCKVLDSPFNPDYTTCECTLVPDGNRRLSVQDVLGETGITNMVTTSTYIATQFTSTFEASTDFTKPEDAQKVLIVILMFAILWSAGILSLCVLFVSRYKRIQKTAMERRRSTKAGGSTTHTVADIKKYLLNYVDKLIPDVYHSAKGKMERAMEETRKHHRYLQLFTARDDQIDVNKRILTLTKMLTVQTMLMFLLAVLYDLQGPDDDGSCPGFDAKSACLNRKSILDSSQNYCQWKIDTNVGYDTCTYNPPNFTLKILIYIIILTSIFTSICNTPIDKLFDMLEAPTEQTVGVSRLVKAGQAVAAGARRASVAGAQMAKAAVANVKQLSFFQKMTKKNPEEDVLAHRRIPDDVAFAHTLAYMALPEISAQAQVTHLQQTVASNEIRSVAVKRMNQIRGSDKKGVNKDEVRGAEAVAEPVKKDIDRSMDQLLEEIMQQRLILPADSEETTEFDTQWGIEKSVSQDARTVSTSLFVNSESLKGISKDVTGSDEKMKELKQKMQNFSDNQAGLDILHLFMVDLLGRHTLAAKIFENKFEEDFERTDVVSKPMKWLVVFLIICVNGFFMYYSLLKGFTKGIHWQNQYLGGCITQLFIEIFLFETLECIWINYWVPDLVSSEVMRAGTVLKEAAEKISLADKNAGHQDAETTKYFLDAPSYLFVSTKLAKAFPKLLESIIVTSYRNHLPGEIARTWRNQHSNGKSYKVETEIAIKKTFGGNGIMGTMVFNCIVALTSTIVIALQALGSLPYFYQRIIIRIVQPVLLSGLTLLWYFAVHNPILFAVIGSLIAITIMVLFLRYKNRLAKAKMAKVQPVNPSSSRMREKVRDMGEAKVNEMVPVGTSLNGPLSAATLSGKKDAKDASSMASSEDGHAAVQPAAAAAAPKRLPNVAEDDSSSDYSY